MSDYIKYMYREYLEGRTRIKKVNEDQPLFPNTGAGLLIQKNKLTDDWTALNVSDGHYEEESFNHEALAAAFLQGANMGQLRMLNEILDRARLNGPYCLENVADALLSFAPACKTESLMENPMLHFIELSKSFSKNGGIYDPVHGIRNDVDKLRLKSKRASSELLHLNESIAAESIRMETVLKAADFNRLDKTKVSMLIESVYVHKRDPKSGTQAIDITWKF